MAAPSFTPDSFLSSPHPIHEENRICFAYNMPTQNVSTSHLLPCRPQMWATSNSCLVIMVAASLASLPPHLIPLYLEGKTARMILPNQDRTFYNSTQNPKMPHPFHSELKPKCLQHAPGTTQCSSCPRRIHFLLSCPFLTFLQPHGPPTRRRASLHRAFALTFNSA